MSFECGAVEWVQWWWLLHWGMIDLKLVYLYKYIFVYEHFLFFWIFIVENYLNSKFNYFYYISFFIIYAYFLFLGKMENVWGPRWIKKMWS